MSETATRPRPRIESLSDLIFGLALSIGAISLIGNPPTTDSGLYNDLVSFAFSFLVLISIWIRYTQVMSVLPLEDGRTIFLNIVLLFCVSIEPFLFNLIQRNTSGNNSFADLSSRLFAIDIGAMLLILGFFTYLITIEDKKLIPNEDVKHFRLQSYTQIIAGVLFFLSSLGIFWQIEIYGTPLRFEFWIAPAILMWSRRSYQRVAKKHKEL